MIKVIAAMDADKLIGKDNKLPWHLTNDLRHFRKTTLGKTIVMGRKTFDGIGLLPGRETIVLSKRSQRLELPQLTFENNVERVVELSKNIDVYVVGGSSIYEIFLPYAKEMILTHIREIFNGDAYFPEYDESEWLVVKKEDFTVEDGHAYNHSIIHYAKI